MPVLGGCKPNWDIGIWVIFPGILPLSNWDIGILLAKFGILGYRSDVYFCRDRWASQDLGYWDLGPMKLGYWDMGPLKVGPLVLIDTQITFPD